MALFPNACCCVKFYFETILFFDEYNLIVGFQRHQELNVHIALSCHLNFFSILIGVLQDPQSLLIIYLDESILEEVHDLHLAVLSSCSQLHLATSSITKFNKLAVKLRICQPHISGSVTRVYHQREETKHEHHSEED